MGAALHPVQARFTGPPGAVDRMADQAQVLLLSLLFSAPLHSPY